MHGILLNSLQLLSLSRALSWQRWDRDKELNVAGLCRLWLARSCSAGTDSDSRLCARSWKSHSVDEADYTDRTGLPWVFFSLTLWKLCYCDLWKCPVLLQPWIRYFIPERGMCWSVRGRWKVDRCHFWFMDSTRTLAKSISVKRLIRGWLNSLNIKVC